MASVDLESGVKSSSRISWKFEGVKAVVRALGLPKMWNHIRKDKKSMNLFWFLSVNVAFMALELFYGLWSNSLGLISDAGHMMMDCMALLIGLVATYTATFPPDDKFAFGYARFEVLSGYTNGVLLLFVALFIFIESIGRISSPQHVHGDRLVLISVLGFVVNIVGLVFFHDHAHGHTSCSNSSCSHSKSIQRAETSNFINNINIGLSSSPQKPNSSDVPKLLSEASKSNSDSQTQSVSEKLPSIGQNRSRLVRHSRTIGRGRGRARAGGKSRLVRHLPLKKNLENGCSQSCEVISDNGNKGGSLAIKGIFLHVLADTLGSIGVIVSSYLTTHFGLVYADPICSLCISIIIFLSVIPLLKESSQILLQRTPEQKLRQLELAANQLSRIKGVISYRALHCWALSNVNDLVLTVHVQVEKDASERAVEDSVRDVLMTGLGAGINLTVQIEKPNFLTQIDPILLSDVHYYNPALTSKTST
eukprot:CAMPEP_0167770716 /NCGR_PEP_ID=MMETSP0110_2-20121227/18092_1 /TAXON_ID=629695 /ORGANISM="Gymnochlora sp., Strain CCMP2014" /LENGTH=476 /DNA_ID=CAMNT_0007659961 /DNA_START=918 /DNA_END=2348 /DNA_ORIENTATION=-